MKRRKRRFTVVRTNLHEAADGAAGLQVGAVQDPLARRHRCKVLLIAQRRSDDDVGTAGIEGLLVQDDASYLCNVYKCIQYFLYTCCCGQLIELKRRAAY